MENWKIVRLGDVCELQSGGTPSRSKTEYWKNGTIPWVKIGDFSGKYLNKTTEHITPKGLENSSAKLFSKGTILYSIFATLGEATILNIDATTNQAIAGIKIKDKSSIDIDYLFAYLNSLKEEVNRIGRGVAQNNINLSILKSFSVPLPPLETQENIAAVLDKCTALIAKHKLMLEKYDTLIKSRFIEMFGDPVKNPMGWEVYTVEECATKEPNSLKAGPFGSSLKKEFYVETGYKIYGQEQVISGDANFGDYYIDEKKFNELKSCEVKANDVLISLVGTYGKLLIIPQEFQKGIINPRLLKITFDKSKIDTVFFKYFFASDSLQKKLTDNTHGGTMGILNLGIVRKIKIPVPPISLQNNFAAFVQQIDKSKFAVQKSLEKAETLYKSLMQEYFG
ncbi:MAG: restriction endonuclease subunit S [Treponema sp.]|nr:restriction endonuclease subunit S [Treponema sp.]